MICDTSTPFDIRFRFLGFPCTISVFFWIGACLLSGVNLAAPNGVQFLLIWIVALLISIMLHELGHALAARQFGARVIDVRLTMLGGYCQYDRHPKSRWMRITISLAGPCAGFLLWGLLMGCDRTFGLLIEAQNTSIFLSRFLGALLYVNLAWGIFNLLPILPLDGGHVSEELCEAVRMPNSLITARWIGIVTASIIIVILLSLRAASLMLVWMALFAVQNYQEIQVLRAERRWGSGYGYANDEPWR